ncbi:MAG: winged helix-turn-helix domain-containing protein, partial [Rhodobacter sp.]|nr:winged helix-turn-helix domain-containing protein [Rhodobacter sp.]
LVNRKVPHRPRRLAPAQLAELSAWVAAGPDPARDGVVRWRRRDLQARIAAESGVILHERTVGKQLATPGLRRLSVRPQHPKPNPVENVWACLRANKPAITVFDTCDDIVKACCTAWNFFAKDPKAIASITSRSWAEVS